MTESNRRIFTILVASFVIGSTAGSAQSRPNLSGAWVLVEALMSGGGRNAPEGGSAGPRRTSSTTTSGAVFNCGTECTITQKGQTLTIENAQLADYPGKDKSKPTPTVTLHLDGRKAEVVDSFSPSRQIPVSARWDGNKLSITSSEPGVGFTQTLSVEGGQLVVVTESARHGGQTIFKYKKK